MHRLATGSRLVGSSRHPNFPPKSGIVAGSQRGPPDWSLDNGGRGSRKELAACSTQHAARITARSSLQKKSVWPGVLVLGDPHATDRPAGETCWRGLRAQLWAVSVSTASLCDGWSAPQVCPSRLTRWAERALLLGGPPSDWRARGGGVDVSRCRCSPSCMAGMAGMASVASRWLAAARVDGFCMLFLLCSDAAERGGRGG